MTRWFNTAGECDPAHHYMIAAEKRIPEANLLVEQMSYFVVHAPRQTGKTTALRALARRLTAEGKYAGLLFSCEVGGVARDDYLMAEQLVVGDLLRKAAALPAELRPPPLPDTPSTGLLSAVLQSWAEACPRPLVLVLDEIDALTGQSLIYVLQQLRAGHGARPRRFPWSIVLCGLRDVRDYRAASGGDPGRLGTSSPFNIKVQSLLVRDFTLAEVNELYSQHTADTRQPFTEQAVARAFELTRGQPWLVNALARKIVQDIGVPAPEPVTAEHVEDAKERLVLERATHLDSLVEKLREPRVRRVVEPILAGLPLPGGQAALDYDDDVSYARDLGLVSGKPLAIANPIYREVVARVLSTVAEDQIAVEPARFRLPDGRLAHRRLLRAFAAFWREHGEPVASAVPYSEVAAQIVLMAFFQRVVNGGGFIDREYGVGSGRIDLLVRFPYRKPEGRRAVQRRALEMKVWRPGRPDPLKEGLAQLDRYLSRLKLSRGTLVVFDARDRLARKPPRFVRATTPSGRKVTVLRA